MAADILGTPRAHLERIAFIALLKGLFQRGRLRIGQGVCLLFTRKGEDVALACPVGGGWKNKWGIGFKVKVFCSFIVSIVWCPSNLTGMSQEGLEDCISKTAG